MNNFAHTVAAISTPPGKGGVAVIRISGPDALEICEKAFIGRVKPLSGYAPRTSVYGDIVLDGEKIDDVLAVYFKAPNSYTGEDTVEISCHGGVLVTSAVLSALFSFGAKQAGPGEFTRRAFINGRLSLTDAEAIGKLLDAKSMAQVRLSAASSRDKLNLAVEEARKGLVNIMSSLFARIDYPDEDLGEISQEKTVVLLEKIKERLEKLKHSYRTGKSISMGIDTVICGKPNSGKSSLYNLLLGEDRAIITEYAGTTRDVLRESVVLGNVTLNLCDTAGIHDTEDPVEKIGVERSVSSIEEAELLLAVFDSSKPLDFEDEKIIEKVKKEDKITVAILNKSDIGTNTDTENRLKKEFKYTVNMSAKQGDYLMLQKIICDLFTDGSIKIGDDAIVSSARQFASVSSALGHVEQSINAFKLGFACDVASSDIELAISEIGQIDGREVSESIVSDIFSRFCVGK